ncbi:MAG: hypothetical protein ACYC0Z_16670 [Acidobacteriaceae bacterium]
MATHDNDFLQQIKEAPTDIHLIGYLSQLSRSLKCKRLSPRLSGRKNWD